MDERDDGLPRGSSPRGRPRRDRPPDPERLGGHLDETHRGHKELVAHGVHIRLGREQGRDRG
jgi:hypothetical protein